MGDSVCSNSGERLFEPTYIGRVQYMNFCWGETEVSFFLKIFKYFFSTSDGKKAQWYWVNRGAVSQKILTVTRVPVHFLFIREVEISRENVSRLIKFHCAFFSSFMGKE